MLPGLEPAVTSVSVGVNRLDERVVELQGRPGRAGVSTWATHHRGNGQASLNRAMNGMSVEPTSVLRCDRSAQREMNYRLNSLSVRLPTWITEPRLKNLLPKMLMCQPKSEGM